MATTPDAHDATYPVLREVIASGAFCTVHTVEGRANIVAKVYSRPYQCARALRAIDAIKESTTSPEQLAHIESVIDIGARATFDGSVLHICPFVIMPKYEVNFGDYVHAYTDEHGTGLPAIAVLATARQLFGALSVLERARIVHGDIKPSNLMFRATPIFALDSITSFDIVLCDFGSARILAPDVVSCHPAIVGSDGFIAPEIMLGLGYSFSADVWSAMSTIMSAITGDKSFDPYNGDCLDFGEGTESAFADEKDDDEDEDDGFAQLSSQSDQMSGSRTSVAPPSHEATMASAPSSMSATSDDIDFMQMYAMIFAMYAILGAPPASFCEIADAYYVNGAPRYHRNAHPGSINNFLTVNYSLGPNHVHEVSSFLTLGLQYMPQDRASAARILASQFLSNGT
jgi:serine/threonine protein kinase